VRSPLTLTACSMSFGSSERLVAMCYLPHISLHIALAADNAAAIFAVSSRKERPSTVWERGETGGIVGEMIRLTYVPA
jgi:hypothetical protein